MNSKIDSSFILDVLRVASENDECDVVWWRTDGEYAPVTFFVNCNDIFAWACSDCEIVTPENLPILDKSIKDCADEEMWGWGGALFCARVRQQRPQGAVLKDIKNAVILSYFNECGPKRSIDFFNPYSHPEDGGKYEYSSSKVE